VAGYWSFLAFATLLILVPGPDFAVVLRNTLVGGRRRGLWAAAGVTASNVTQGMAAAVGLSAIVLRSQPLFEAVRWIGAAYLLYLGVQALDHARDPRPVTEPEQRRGADGFRQGFLSNITNPKVLVFYIAVLPQFLNSSARLPMVIGLALTHAVLGLAWLSVVVLAVQTLRRWLLRTPVRRALDAVTGAVLVGFGVILITEERR
jgi:threonine/homoserine/homoserine lactone efflux protein